jgi:hypothetical protein
VKILYKKSILMLIPVFLFLCVFKSSVFAYDVQFLSDANTPYNYSNGGEFTLQITNSSLNWLLGGYKEDVTKNVLLTTSTFETFCLEKSEYISFGTGYFATIDSAAIGGGTDSGNVIGDGKDTLSIGAAWLYYNFAKGSLTGYNYPDTGGTRASSAGTLQQTIWYLEGEQTILPTNHTFYDQAVAYASSISKDVKADNDRISVAVLNLWNNAAHTSLAQSQIIVTPIPGALLLFGSGLIGLVGLRRKKKF